MTKHMLVATLLAAMIGSGVVHAADGSNSNDREKCYGIVKAGKNDCAAKDKSHACAGQAKKDADTNSWVYLPIGLCDKLAGGAKG